MALLAIYCSRNSCKIMDENFITDTCYYYIQQVFNKITVNQSQAFLTKVGTQISSKQIANFYYNT